jgi:hypothetical protein
LIAGVGHWLLGSVDELFAEVGDGMKG